VADVLAQIRALIALSASDNLDEARNASLAATRLIRKYGAIISLPPENIGTSFPAPTSKRRGDGWRRIKAKYAGVCVHCRQSIRKNTPIWWSFDKGAMHKDCYEPSGKKKAER